MNKIVHLLFIIFCLLCCNEHLYAQVKEPSDTFFLLKKKGLLKRLGKSIYRENIPEDPIKSVDPFLAFKGKTIRRIRIAPTGFNRIINDTIGVKKTFISGLVDALHKNTLPAVIRKNLFFKEGDKVLPLLLADNERFLRDLTFIKDAVIVLQPAAEDSSMADVIIITRDVFSIGGSLTAGSLTNARIVAREDNMAGTGNKIELTGLYDKDRNPDYGIGGSLTLRNINRHFIDWTVGFNTFNPAFNSGRREETSYFTLLEKPLVSRYTEWTGAVSFSYNKTNNGYISDSEYVSFFKYRALSADIWGGYNIGSRNRKDRDMGKRLRHFVAMRTFYNNFYHVPDKFEYNYNYVYANINGMLASYSLYRQNFYKTNFIYGFGRNEDIPEGINATAISGYTNKQGVKRAYYGLEFDATHFSEKGCFTAYTFRAGGFAYQKQLQDIDMLIGLNKFTKLYTLSSSWRNRNFFFMNYSRQYKTALNAPLFLESTYALPYFRNTNYGGDARATVKMESVFYNLKRFLGFRFAPFVFSDFSLLKPINEPIKNTNGYTAIGGGLRTRNENLTFGTVEIRGYYFPRVNDGMKNWRVEIGTNLKFRYNSSFIRKPDFVSPN